MFRTEEKKKKKEFKEIKFNHLMSIYELNYHNFKQFLNFKARESSENLNTKKNFNKGIQMIKDGADFIDIGGESTRPGSKAINVKLEWKRINKILKFICKKVPVSLDTRKAEIMEKGIKQGVKIINDV